MQRKILLSTFKSPPPTVALWSPSVQSRCVFLSKGTLPATDGVKKKLTTLSQCTARRKKTSTRLVQCCREHLDQLQQRSAKQPRRSRNKGS